VLCYFLQIGRRTQIFEESTVKYLVVVGDGMADYPIDALNGKTPLEAASTPAMDEIAARGITGLFCPIPEGFDPGSDIGNLSLFGYDPGQTFSGRAPLEAANQGITLEKGQVAFRCNLVTLDDGVMRDFTAGHISSEEAKELILALDGFFGQESVRLYPGVSYRHLAVLDAQSDDEREALRTAVCVPPHNISDQAYGPHVPAGPGATRLLDLMRRAGPVLADHPVNRARVAAGKLPATGIWLWGQGTSPVMATYEQRFGLKGAVISAVDLVKGIGVLAGLEVIDVPGATGYVDTNYEGKVAAAIEALERVDFVYLHVEAPDEASHEGDLTLKMQAIEDFDARVVRACLDYVKQYPATRLLVSPDHITALSTRTHATGPVPFALCGKDVAPGGVSVYNEKVAAATGFCLARGFDLVPRMLRAEKLDSVALQATEG
jgi:2,3-bisphosphoglycerate-independent phosphoglycerate mutase